MSSDNELHDEFEGLNFDAISDPTVTTTTTQATSSTTTSISITNDRDRSRIYTSRLYITPPSSECSNADDHGAEDDESVLAELQDRLVRDQRHSESITLTSLRGPGNISSIEQRSLSQISLSASERIQRYEAYHLSHATSEPVLLSRFFGIVTCLSMFCNHHCSYINLEAPAESSQSGLNHGEAPLSL